MAPKRGSKPKSQNARKSPALAMMVESSPDRAESSRSTTISKPIVASFGLKKVSFDSKIPQGTKKAADSTLHNSAIDLKGKSKEEAVVSDHMLWCDLRTPSLKVSSPRGQLLLSSRPVLTADIRAL